MQSRESRLLLVAVALGLLAVQPLACGGNDKSSTNNNNGDSDITGDSNNGDSDTTSAQTKLCQDIADKIDSCKSCDFDTQAFISKCENDTITFNSGFHDASVNGTCDDINGMVCGTCPGNLTCAGVTDRKDGSYGVCVTTTGNGIPDNAPTCTSTCTDELMPCVLTSPTSGNCFVSCDPFTHGTCSGSTVCTVLDNYGAVCTNTNGGPPSGATLCPNGNECSATQACLPAGSNGSSTKYCVEMCDAPPCPSGTTCQDIRDSNDDTRCVTANGGAPSDAKSCSTTSDCPLSSACSDGVCLQICFLTGDASTSSRAPSTRNLLKH